MFELQQNPSANFSSNFSQQHNRLPPPPPHYPPPYDAYNDGFVAKRMRRPVQRRVVDYTSDAIKYLQVRKWQRDERDRTVLQPTSTAVTDMLPPVAYTGNPSTSFAARFVHASMNKNRCPIYQVVWTPTGRRLITGAQTGEFTLWNGQSFNFEMLLQAHDKPVRSMVWSHNGNWMVTGDDGGSIKYWQNNMNNVKVNESSHKESIRDLSFSSTDLKFCSCSDDGTVKVWDFGRCLEERALTGHGWDVKCADWHPKKPLIASGGKDTLVKLWDAKSGRDLCSLHGHKNMVLSVKWNQNGNWLLTSSKDQLIKLYDIRSMKELQSFHGHQKDVTALAWHPSQEEYFASGCYDGSIFHWLVGHDSPQVEIRNAHEGSVWDLAWHPTGFLLCSGSHDHTAKFWCRNRPGDTASDKYIGHYSGNDNEQNYNLSHMMSEFSPAANAPPNHGPFALSQNHGTIPGIGVVVPSGGAPPLPPGPPPGHLLPGQQQNYQQFWPQQQQQQLLQPQNQQLFFQQQFGQMTTQRPPNFQMPLHQLMSQGQPLGMPSNMGPQQNLTEMQGPANQMMPPMPQGHVVNTNQLHPGQNGGLQNFMFNHQMPQFPGLNNFQNGMISGGNMGLPPPPLPPLPPN